MVKIKNEKIAIKISDLMADNKLTLSDWKYMIPFYLTKQPDSILIVAKNFADGINYNLSKYNVEIPPEFIVAYQGDSMVSIDKKEYRGH